MSETACEGVADTPPPELWGLDPVFAACARLYVRDILLLKEAPEIPASVRRGIFFYRRRPISKVDVLGIVVQKQEKERLYRYGVDDGTGVITCVCWKQDQVSMGTEPGGWAGGLGARLRGLRLRAQQESHLELGDVISARGRIKVFRDEREISCSSYHRVVDSDCSAQISRMLELPQLYRNFYDKPFHIIQHPTGATPGGQPSGTLLLLEEIKLFLRQSRVRDFHVPELEAVTTLSTIAHTHLLLPQQPAEAHTGSQQERSGSGSRLIHTMFREVIDLLQEEGVVFPKTARPDTLYLVTDEQQHLQTLTLKIIREDSGRTGRGCCVPWMLSCVQSCYPEVSQAALTRVLSSLECNSDIVSTSDSHYIAV